MNKRTIFDLIVVNVTKEELPDKYDADFLKLFDHKPHRDRIVICFMGWDEDPREICQIPECKQWLQGLFEKVPQLFYYLSPHMRNIEVLFLTMMKSGSMLIKGKKESSFEVDGREANALAVKLVRQAVAYALKVGDSPSAVAELDEKFRSNVMK